MKGEGEGRGQRRREKVKEVQKGEQDLQLH